MCVVHRERHKDYLEELMRYGTEDPSRVHAHSFTHATAATPHTDKLATVHKNCRKSPPRAVTLYQK